MAHRYKSYLPHQVSLDRQSDGALIMGSTMALGPVARNTGEWLRYWADTTPQQIFIAERSGAGWRSLSYAETLQQVEALASGLLHAGIKKGDHLRPVDHASTQRAALKAIA